MFFPEIKSLPHEDIAILVKLDNHSHHYICDCGYAGRLTAKECQNTRALFISHTHIDHFIHFDFIMRNQVDSSGRVVVCGPPGIYRQVQAKLKGYTWNLIGKGAMNYEVREIVNENHCMRYELEPPGWEGQPLEPLTGNTIYKNDRFQVKFTLLDHRIPSVAYLFGENDSLNIALEGSGFRGGSWVRDLKTAFEKKDEAMPIRIEDTAYPAGQLFPLLKVRPGNTLGIIMDHAAHDNNHQKILKTFYGCDQVFIESFYTAADKALAATNYHSYSTASGSIMRQCAVKEAVPVHFSRKYDEKDIQGLVGEFEEAKQG